MDISIFKDNISKWSLFEEHIPSTCTGIVRFKYPININFEEFFDSVELVSCEYKKTNIKGNKWKVIFKENKNPGDIVSARCGYKTKGPVCSVKADNQIEIKMCLKEKIVNLKIHVNSFHITGCKGQYHILESIEYLNKIYNFNIEVSSADLVMISITYNLGFKVNRSKLNEFMRNDGYYISSFPRYNRKGVILLRESKIIRKGKPIKHIFTIYSSGNVTQIGSTGEMAEEYNKFRRKIEQNKEYFVDI